MTGEKRDWTLHLLRAAQSGDEGAVEQLLTRFRERLLLAVRLLLARRQGGLLEDEEDIVQETLLDALHDLGTFTPRNEGSMLAWLTKMAENNLRDAVRREHAERRGGGRVRRRADLPSQFLISSVFPGKEGTPSQAAVGRELADEIESVLIALPERRRRIFVLRQLCALSFEEIARELGLSSAAAARTLYSRTMTELARCLPESDAD